MVWSTEHQYIHDGGWLKQKKGTSTNNEATDNVDDRKNKYKHIIFPKVIPRDQKIVSLLPLSRLTNHPLPGSLTSVHRIPVYFPRLFNISILLRDVVLSKFSNNDRRDRENGEEKLMASRHTKLPAFPHLSPHNPEIFPSRVSPLHFFPRHFSILSTSYSDRLLRDENWNRFQCPRLIATGW